MVAIFCMNPVDYNYNVSAHEPKAQTAETCPWEQDFKMIFSYILML